MVTDALTAVAHTMVNIVTYNFTGFLKSYAGIPRVSDTKPSRPKRMGPLLLYLPMLGIR